MATSGSISCNAQNYNGEIRTIVFSWSLKSQSEKDNQSVISWTLKGGGINNGYRYVTRETLARINNSQVYYKGTDRVSIGYGELLPNGSGTFTIKHDSNGNSNITLYLGTAYNEWQINVSNTQTWALPKINRLSSISCETLTMGTEGTITVTRESTNFQHRVYSLFGDTSPDGLANGKGIKEIIYDMGTDESIKWTPPLDMAYIIPNKSVAEGSLVCETYSGSTYIGYSAYTYTVKIPENIVPTLTDLHYELDSSPFDIIDNQWQVAVQGFTRVNLSALQSEALGVYGSTIKSFEITGAYTANVSGDQLDYKGSIITTTGNKSFSVVAIDSRGRRSAKKTVKVNYLEYSTPYITGFHVGRNEAEKNDLDIFFNAVYSKVGGHNQLSRRLMYKKKSSNTWLYYGEIESDKTVTISDNPNTTEVEFEWYSTYDVQILIVDSIGNSFSVDGIVPTLEVTMDFAAGGKAVSFGKTAEIQNAVEIYDHWDFYVHGKEIKELIFESIYPVGRIYLTTSDENPSVTLGFGTWERWGRGRVPVGVDDEDEALNMPDMTGGTKTEEISDLYVTGSNYGGIQTSANTGSYESRIYVTPPSIKNSEGSAKHIPGTTTHNNMQPYITCYMWKRTA